MLWWLVLPSAIVSGVAWMGSSRVYYLDLLVSQQIWLAWGSVLLLAAIVAALALVRETS